jgi:hypothetical protein
VNAERAADSLSMELTAAGVPRAFRCQVLDALENWLRVEKGRGNILERAGLALALEAVKRLAARVCPQPEN